MDVFKVVKFESNNLGDDACKQLSALKKFPQNKKKGKKKKIIAAGRVEKNNKKKIVLQKKNTINPPSSVDLRNKIKKFKKEQINKTGTQNKKKKKNTTLGRVENNDKGKKTVLQEQFKEEVSKNETQIKIENNKLTYKQRKILKLKEKLKETISLQTQPKNKQPEASLRTRMLARLQSARFRYINEQIYSNDSKEAQKIFTQDPEAFKAYHDGYKQQVNKWPLNPLDVIIKSIQKMPKTHVIADMGCGDAKLSLSVTQKVHSFDLVAVNDSVTACDMARVPLPDHSVDVVVFCLSLMGTNLRDYLSEANRILKQGGLLKIAEVESRFDDVNVFVEGLRRFHFKNIWKDLSHNLFYFLDFKKDMSVKNKKKLPTLSLHPCLYKKR